MNTFAIASNDFKHQCYSVGSSDLKLKSITIIRENTYSHVFAIGSTSRLLDKGHSVTGVEVAGSAIAEFFKDSDLQFTVEDCPQVDGKLYKAS